MHDFRTVVGIHSIGDEFPDNEAISFRSSSVDRTTSKQRAGLVYFSWLLIVSILWIFRQKRKRTYYTALCNHVSTVIPKCSLGVEHHGTRIIVFVDYCSPCVSLDCRSRYYTNNTRRVLYIIGGTTRFWLLDKIRVTARRFPLFFELTHATFSFHCVCGVPSTDSIFWLELASFFVRAMPVEDCGYRLSELNVKTLWSASWRWLRTALHVVEHPLWNVTNRRTSDNENDTCWNAEVV